MSKIKNAIKRLHDSVANFGDNNGDLTAPPTRDGSPLDLGGCVFSIGKFRIFMPAYFRSECESLSGEFKDECDPTKETCYKGAVRNSSSGSTTKADFTPPPPGGCEPRYPNQPPYGPPRGKPPRGWFGGGNTCGDPYLGWHPLCEEKFTPVTINSKMKATEPNGTIKLFGCPSAPSYQEGQVPVPIIEIIVDTRGLQISPIGSTPAPGFHVQPGPLGPPRDGGIWRGFRPGGSVINPQFLQFLRDRHPECLNDFCLGGSIGLGPKQKNATIEAEAMNAPALLSRRCSLIQSGLCNNTPGFQEFLEKYFPNVVSGGTNIFECEKAICQLHAPQISHIIGGGSNQFNWDNALGPELFDPRNICPALTGLGNLKPAQTEIRNKCAGAMDFLANIYNASKRSYSPYQMYDQEYLRQGLNDGCYNCLVFINPNTGEWLPLDFPWPKTPEQQIETIYTLVEKGKNVDWVCEQGCSFEWFCNVDAGGP